MKSLTKETARVGMIVFVKGSHLKNKTTPRRAIISKMVSTEGYARISDAPNTSQEDRYFNQDYAIFYNELFRVNKPTVIISED